MTQPVDKRSTLLVGTVISVGLVTASLLVPMPLHGRVSAAVGDMVHGPLFAVLTVVTIAVSNRLFTRSPRQFSLTRTLAIAVGWFCFGVVIEFAQALSGRSSSIIDVFSNGLGVIAGCCFSTANFWRTHKPTARRLPRVLWLAAGFLIAIVWWQPIATLTDVVAMKANFPLLASFESIAELERWHFYRVESQRSRRDATLGDRSLEVTFATADHPSATLIHFPRDWSRLSSIEVDATLDSGHPEATAKIWLHVVDALAADDSGDSFRKPFTIRRGETSHLVIPRDELVRASEGRSLDLNQIRFFEFQMLQPPVATTIRFDFLRLKL